MKDNLKFMNISKNLGEILIELIHTRKLNKVIICCTYGRRCRCISLRRYSCGHICTPYCRRNPSGCLLNFIGRQPEGC